MCHFWHPFGAGDHQLNQVGGKGGVSRTAREYRHWRFCRGGWQKSRHIVRARPRIAASCLGSWGGCGGPRANSEDGAKVRNIPRPPKAQTSPQRFMQLMHCQKTRLCKKGFGKWGPNFVAVGPAVSAVQNHSGLPATAVGCPPGAQQVAGGSFSVYLRPCTHVPWRRFDGEYRFKVEHFQATACGDSHLIAGGPRRDALTEWSVFS